MMSDAVSKAISENLPSAVGKELQERLAYADKLERIVGELRIDKQNLRSELDRVNGVTADLRAQLAQHDTIDERQTQLREQELKVAVREAIADQLVQRVDDHKRMVELIFRNTTLRRRWDQHLAVDGGSCHAGGYDNNGSPVITQNGGYVTTKEATSEETDA